LNSIADETTQKSKDFPKSPRGLRSKLERIAPNLRAIGINVKFLERDDGGRVMTLEDLRNRPSERSRTSESLEDGIKGSDGCVDGLAFNNNQPSINRQSTNLTNNHQLKGESDNTDDSDGQNHKCSICTLDLELTPDKKQFYCSMGCGSIPA
jgi:hypothetical protein